MNTNPYTNDGRDLRAEVEPYLHGEELLWVGQPYTTRPYRLKLIALVFVLFWTGFAVFWTVGASLAGGPFGLFGLPFVAFGVFMCYRFFVGDKKRYAQTVYAVTDRRAIILTPGRRGINCTEYVFHTLQTLSLEEVEGDTGTIRFRSESTYYADDYSTRRTGSISSNAECAFYAIDDVHTVYRLISERAGR